MSINQTALKGAWLALIDHPEQPRYPAGSLRWSLQRWWNGDVDRLRVGWDKERWEIGPAERRSYHISTLAWAPIWLPFAILSVIVMFLIGFGNVIFDSGKDVANDRP